MPAPRTKWEQQVDRAMRAGVRAFGENLDADGIPKITYTHTGQGLTYQVDGIFEATTMKIDLDTGAEVMSHEPRVGFPLSVLQATPREGDIVTIRSRPYKVVELSFDGQGTVTLRLHVAIGSTGGSES